MAQHSPRPSPRSPDYPRLTCSRDIQRFLTYPPRPSRRRRCHDSATAGDPNDAYHVPSIVVISENKDTALHFRPSTPNPVQVGRPPRGHCGVFPGEARVSNLFYWGDMDASGPEILDGFAQLAPVTTLMDLAT